MIPKPVQYARLALILLSLWIGITVATAQGGSCQEATPFDYFDCQNYDLQTTHSVTLCYSKTTAGDSLDFTFGTTVWCPSSSIQYTLLNSFCDTIETNSTGNFSVAPNVFYVLCVTVACEDTVGIGVQQVCATEMLTLPVEFLGLVAYPTDAGVVLSWATGSESGSERFEVFRMATEGDRGTLLASLRAAGYSTGRTEYRWTDVSPEPGLRLYRVEGVDVDGARRVLAIVPVTWTRPDRSSLGPWDVLGRRIRP